MRPRSGGRRSLRQLDAQPLQRTLDVADRVDGDAGVERRGLELGVAEQHLDQANIDALLEQRGVVESHVYYDKFTITTTDEA